MAQVMEPGITSSRARCVLLRPSAGYFSGTMKHSQDLDSIQSWPDAIRNDIARVRHDEFASAVDTPRVAQGRVFSQETHGMVDSLYHKLRGLRIIFGNVAGFLVEILQSRSQPPNLHLPPLFEGFPYLFITGKFTGIGFLYCQFYFLDLPLIQFYELAKGF